MSVTITISRDTAAEALEDILCLLGGASLSRQDIQTPMPAPEDVQWGRVAEIIKEATPVEDKPRRGRKAKTEAAPAPIEQPAAAISTGEERVDPTLPAQAEDPTEDDIQDMADEQAETDATRAADTPLTIDDVRKMAMGYYEKFGKEAAIEDGGPILADALGVPPNGEKIWKMSIIPDDQIILRKAMLALQTATAGAERYKSAGA